MVIVGGVIPKQDYQYLFDAGTVAVFGPGTKISETAITSVGYINKLIIFIRFLTKSTDK